MLTNKGYNLIMWVITFAALIAALAVIQVPLKRGVQTKIRAVTDYVFWTRLDSATDQHMRETNSRASTYNEQNREVGEVIGDHTGTNTYYDKISSADNNLNYGTSKGSEAILDVLEEDLNSD
jgi:hypothetical protein